VKWLDSVWTRWALLVLLLGVVALLLLGVFTAQRELQSRTEDDRRATQLQSLERTASEARFLLADMNGWQSAYTLEFTERGVKALQNSTGSRARFLRTASELQAALTRLGARSGELTSYEVTQLRQARAAFTTFMARDTEVFQALQSGDLATARGLVLGTEILEFERIDRSLQAISASVTRQDAELRRQWQDASRGAYRQLLTFSSGVALSLVLMLTLVVLSVQQRTRLIQRLSWQARTDGLTGLLNRRAWDEGYPLALARARRTGQPLSVVMLDLDRFKQFNDTYGHAAGDKLLRMTAQSLQRSTRVTDIVARYGGEEFALALEGCTAEDAVTLLNRVKSQLPEGRTFSAGVVQTKGEDTPAALLERADKTLYAAKRAGRDCVLIAGKGTTSTRDSSVTLVTQVA
jgi:diguanylate cyclase (GGDEF)-like protein